MMRAWSLWIVLGGLALLSARAAAADPAEDPAPKKITFLKAWGNEGSAPGEFGIPIGIAINAADELFVTDHYNDRIAQYDTEGKLVASYPVESNPGGIGLDNSGNWVVTHFAATTKGMNKTGIKDFICIYSPKGKLLRQWGQHGTADGEFDCPGGVVVAKNGRIYIADETNHRVQVFDGEGKFLFKWGEYGNETGQFGGKSSRNSRTGGPQFIALDSAGNVWTTEGANGRVQKFTPEGKFLLAWGENTDKPGGFGGSFAGFEADAIKAGTTPPPRGSLQGPIALCFDAKGQLWISAVCGRVQQFTPEGKFLRGLVEAQGDKPGQFYAPHQLAFDSHGDLYVVDAFNHRIQKFRVPR